jgi:hypothetical protein
MDPRTVSTSMTASVDDRLGNGCLSIVGRRG